MASDKPSILSRLKFLIHPIAMGVYLTLSFSAFSLYYYIQKDNKYIDSFLIERVRDFDLTTVDIRLRLRGQRPGSPDVAVLAIDDRSLDIVGRWPWPRDTLNKLYKNTFDAGAKMIAADIVLSEASERPELKLIEKVGARGVLNEQALSVINEELNSLDQDMAFAEGLKEYNEKLVLGNFFNNQQDYGVNHANEGYKEACERWAFEQSPAYAMFDLDEMPIIPIDNNIYDMQVPEIISESYIQGLTMIEAGLREGMPKELSPAEEYALKEKVHSRKLEFCRTAFLDSDAESKFQGIEIDDFGTIYNLISANWPLILEQDPDIQHASFDEWVAEFKANQLTNQVMQVDRWTTNIPTIYQNGKYHGYFNAVLDDDGTIRRSQLIARSGSQYIPTISLKGYLIANGYAVQAVTTALDKLQGLKGLEALRVQDDEGEELFDIPVRSDGSMYINYAGDQKMFPYVSAADMLDTELDTVQITYQSYDKATDRWNMVEERVNKRQFLKDKQMVAGATAIAVFDLRLSPFGENYPGVETHANVLDNLVRQDFLKAHPEEEGKMPLILLLLGIIMSIALAKLGAVSGLIFTLVMAGAVAYIERTFFFLDGYITSVMLPMALIGGSYVFMTFYKYFTEERSKKELRQTFSKYVSPSIVAEVLEDPKNLELGGRKEEITVFFSDVAGFTSISEKLDPKDLSDLLNDYLTPMTDLVFQNKGTLDKYIGDAVMAFFGAPIHYNDHAKYAARSSLQQLEKLSELQEKYAKKGLPHIDIRIGLNTGECSVGNMGSETVRNYTVMGDAVNLASRLEAINKYYGTRIMISEFTHAAIKDDFLCREVDWVRVKGKLLPVKIYELMAEGRATDSLDEMKKYFDDGYSLYHEKRFEAAIEAFEKALKANPEDATSKIYIERCQTYASTPPPEDWDGVFVMTTK